ncbi:MAG: helix-turn-helix transcriptional regulator [Actinomycetota bacterium]|nr:helix-turn-helix transcriptional regulator [Actinomycetota bacterium]
MAEERRQMRTTRVEVSMDEERGVFMISVAAELADMHPQTLRIYESKGLITPKRSPKNTRLYSQRDVEKLRRIYRMTNEEGLNLAGVETVLEMEEKVKAMRAELEEMRSRASELEKKLDEEVERVRHKLNTEIVPYGAYDGSAAPERTGPVRIPVNRPR